MSAGHPSLLQHVLLFKALSNFHPELQQFPERTSHRCFSFQKVFLRLYLVYLLINPLRYKVSSAPMQPLREAKSKHGNCNCYDLKRVAGQRKVMEQPPPHVQNGWESPWGHEPHPCTSDAVGACAPQHQTAPASSQLLPGGHHKP